METTTMNMLPTCVQHGMVYVPMGGVSGELGDFQQVSGGSPWGAGCFAVSIQSFTKVLQADAPFPGSRWRPDAYTRGTQNSHETGRPFLQFLSQQRRLFDRHAKSQPTVLAKGGVDI